MKSFKTHFGVIISLIALLFSVQFGIFINNIIKSYEKTIQNQYNIVLVSKQNLTLKDLTSQISQISSISEISTADLISRLKDKVSASSLKALNENLPKFYSIKLKNFPDYSELSQIESRLKKIEQITRVEIFKKTHDEIFKVLNLLKWLVFSFALLIVLLGLMLIYKQMRIWVYEHRQRIEIMEIFGASFIVKSGKLYKMAIIDSIIATLLVIGFYMILPLNSQFIEILQSITPLSEAIILPNEGIILFLSAFVLSIIAVTLVMLEVKKENS